MLQEFRNSLASPALVEELRSGLIGENAAIIGPFGERKLVYADYVASGRALMQVERFILENVLPYYANSHTEASYCGGFMTRMRREARTAIASSCNAGPDHAVIFAGSGATAGINRLVSLLGIADALRAKRRVRVMVGPYEHHSNILPWRECGAEMVEIKETPEGGPDLAQLQSALDDQTPEELTICAFSAASNVTGIVSDVAAVTRLAKASGAKIVWDYAGAGPYLPIDMTPANDCPIDAIVISPHKFIGGPGASGILIVRRDAVVSARPTWPGGGTVTFVSPWGHDYSDSLEAREEAGTPNVVGDIRAALTFLVKDSVGIDLMAHRNAELAQRGMQRLSGMDTLDLLGSRIAPRLPIFSFRVRDGKGGFVHQQLVTRMLSDRFGIQARGGCACAGPYVHRLLDIDATRSTAMREAIRRGREVEKPGFTRFNLSVLMSDEKVDFILDSIAELAKDAASYASRYDVDPARAIFSPKAA
ncbi:aminotransferase class V-fold PLP-dependent enzyme [Mesorhizobium sp. CAU 1741]|uniref:aminotransferase class V-fold PLP-dependent enzyme n=1 Tax=Mesorhizobium sp. CAU 1741 TaxID=3140366 RepID=UPI00325BFF45